MKKSNDKFDIFLAQLKILTTYYKAEEYTDNYRFYELLKDITDAAIIAKNRVDGEE